MPAWAASLRLAAGILLVAGTVWGQPADLVSRTALRVCADPAAWPASTEDGSGYENRIAELLGEALGRPVEYTWYPMSTGFVRNTLRAARCDLIIGYAQGDELVLNTNHWLTSAYVLVTRRDGPFADVTDLSDPRLAEARIGVVAGTPPADHLARHGLLDDVRSYELFADRRYDSPPDRMIADLEAGEIDVALMWGPIAGPMVKQRHPDLVATPLLREPGFPRLTYRITMGVRPGEDAWKREINSLLRRHQDEIDAILRDAGVPVLDDMGTAPKPEG
ncbi:substrate-binding domain-containing protein [Rubellimicrobium sp. CFH 75288]|uniref:substrate-binding domain-containing protein n=1 Tax=Rubellimicrobium sp. CFH 75288 TaxID=2697034 RepID=UPI0014125EFE|nr:substrate-binding domain-containing protein [Rubellimicrobium sp. CFH 75288]NAZ37908.1 quinoprotein dehydrogenase-associated putative ABC transporter substrate-binding protein [Rubellimicrobium sp. CFH 75288]